jgi:proton-coupled amino acid transporter
VFLLYSSFGEFCYLIYGSNIVSPLITSNLPNDPFVGFIKVMFCVNLFFTYPLVIYPANQIIESYIFGTLPKSKKRMWLKNLYRGCMVLFTVVIALLLNDKLGKFISLLGGFACIPITFILPCLFHYKLCAETK